MTCSAPTAIALRLIDNQSGSIVPGIGSQLPTLYDEPGFSDDTKSYGLGSVNGTNIGAYFVRIDGYTLRGILAVGQGEISPIVLTNGYDGQWSHPSGSATGYFDSNGLAHWKAFGKAFAGSAPDTWSSVNGHLIIYPIIDQGSNLPLGQEINLNGSATLEVMYL